MQETIDNIHSFKALNTQSNLNFDITLQQDKKIYCFIGENGIGKTQLLENMAKSLFACINQEFIKKIDVSLYYLQYPPMPFINGKLIDIENGKFSFNMRQPFEIQGPIIFIGAQNRGFTNNIDPNNFKLLPNRNIRLQYALLKTLSYLGYGNTNQNNADLAEWFMTRLAIDKKFINKTEDATYEAITVLKLMNKLHPRLELFTKNTYNEDIPNVSFENGQFMLNHIPFDKLSTGFLSIIKIFQEIISAYASWYPNEKDYSQISGFIFIDELESHLHVKWQTKIIKILREFFPNSTFYIATHSPLILSGLHNGEAYELEQNQQTVTVMPIKDITNYALVDIINEFFDVDINQVKIDNIDMTQQQYAKNLLLDIMNK